MRIVVALGGNALLGRGEVFNMETQQRNAARAATALAPVLSEHQVIITHGNGPQIGLLASQVSADDGEPTAPLDVLGAESEGLIGYLLERELTNVCLDHSFATILTMVEIDPADPALNEPSKPIGPVYEVSEWHRIAAERNWVGSPEGGGMRRVVPSPEPRAIIERAAIQYLLDGNIVPICAGGGGVPVVCGSDGKLRGIEAVIDKDRTSAQLAVSLDADMLLLLTDVEAVYDGWETPNARAIDTASPDDVRALKLSPGSMGPKVEAAARFVESTGRLAVIGSMDAVGQLVCGAAGTRITTDAS